MDQDHQRYQGDNGQVRVKYEMQAPMDVIPANAIVNPFGGQVLGAWVAALCPHKPHSRFRFKHKPPLFGRCAVQAVASGLHAVDGKGNVIQVTNQQQYVQDGNMVRLEYTAIFQLPKGERQRSSSIPAAAVSLLIFHSL